MQRLIAGALIAAGAVAAASAQSIDAGENARLEAPPRSIMEKYVPQGGEPRGPLSLLVEEPGPVAVASRGPADPPRPIGDRINGAAINTLASGRSAITVTTVAMPSR